MSQLDMFEPAHVAFRNEAQYFKSIAAPYLERANAAEAKARELCPHEYIEYEIVYHEDEYGSSCPSWTEIEVKCSFCERYGRMNRDKFNRSDLELIDVLLGGCKNDSNSKN